MKKEKFTYGLLLKGDEVAGTYGVSGIPAIFVIGKDGKVLLQQVGFSPALEDALSEAIDQGLSH
jgi:protein-disulfide isomerase